MNFAQFQQLRRRTLGYGGNMVVGKHGIQTFEIFGCFVVAFVLGV
jgi:hypothetical protein